MSYRNQYQSAGDPGPVVFVLFGATGDLARRMVLPAFYRLAAEGQAVCLRSDDFVEAGKAFLEGRAPAYRGR